MLLELSSDSLLGNSVDSQLDLARLYRKLGEVARRFDESQQTQIYLLGSEILLLQSDSAEFYFQKSHAIAERLAHAEPNRSDFQRDLAVSYGRLGDLARNIFGQSESAQAYFQKSLAILGRLDQANRAHLQPDPFASYPKPLDFLRALTILETLKKDARMLPTDEPGLAKLRELVPDRKPSENPS